MDKAGNSTTHKMLLKLARQDEKMAKNQPHKSFLLQMISSVKCRMQYTTEYIKNMTIFELIHDLNRLNIIVQADAALSGAYSGFCDVSKMDKKILDWTRDISEELKNNNKTILNEGAN